MSQYHHFIIFEREKIFFFRAQNKSIRYIAKELGRSPSSVSRELKRNSINNSYCPSQADQQYKKRRKKCHRIKLRSNPVLFNSVNKLMAIVEQ